MLRNICLALSLFLVAGAPRATAAPIVQASAGDASISQDTATSTWTLAAGGAVLTVALGSNRDFQLLSLVSPAGRNWLSSATSGATVAANGKSLAFGSRAAGFQFESATVANQGGKLELDAGFTLRSPGMRVTRHIAITNGSPSFEMWTSFDSLASASISLSNLDAAGLAVPPGQVHWLTGLQGDSADTNVATAFTLNQQTLASGGLITLGSDGRSSSQTVPWFAIDGAGDEFYSTLMWSGAWSLSIVRTAGTVNVDFSLPSMQTLLDPSTTVEGPHAIVGAARGGLDEAAAGLRSYALNGVRNGQAISPLVTYNTWFAYGVAIDEASMRDEMTRAAAVGTELFVIDAGWYTGAGAAGPFDFESGLGSWQVDPARFPNGLGPLRDYAHSLGMKFGVWVEPERLDLGTIGAPAGADETWLASAAGSYGSDTFAQLCLADAAARRWVLSQLESLIDTVQPDYLKWDNNFWINCDRAGHGHGTSDGNFRHVAGLYSVLATLRQTYPNLLIENVSGGGNRLDFGMLQYSDVAWMDDRTAPSVHVRHNLEGLSAVFPPAYLLSFVTDHAGEPLHDSPDLPLYVRSRMAGALGLCFRSANLSDDDLAQLSSEISTYKDLRSTLSVAAGALLTGQAAQSDSPAWDVLQAAAPGASSLVVYAYQTDPSTDQVSVKPAGLDPAATYAVTSVDTGVLGTAKGSDLMTDGIDVLASPATAAHILMLVVQQ